MKKPEEIKNEPIFKKPATYGSKRLGKELKALIDCVVTRSANGSMSEIKCHNMARAIKALRVSF